MLKHIISPLPSIRKSLKYVFESWKLLQKSQFENLTFSQMTFREIPRPFSMIIVRKPVFGVSDQVISKPACSATETS